MASQQPIDAAAIRAGLARFTGGDAEVYAKSLVRERFPRARFHAGFGWVGEGTMPHPDAEEYHLRIRDALGLPDASTI